MNIITIEDDLYDWIFAIVGPVEVAWLNENGPRSDEYIGMKHNAFRRFGLNGYKSAPDVNDDISIVRDVEFTLMLVGYGSSGFLALYSIFDALENPEIRSNLSSGSTSGLVYIRDEGGVIDSSTKLGNHIEKRASLDIILRLGNVVEYGADIIESTDITVNAKKQQNIVLSKTITVQE